MRCKSPSRIFRNDGSQAIVRCGHCIYCLIHKSKVLQGTLYAEFLSSGSVGTYTTHTYDEEHLPPVTGSLADRLGLPDLLKWIEAYKKRRERAGLPQLKYFRASEFGGQYGRPHHHILIFGEQLRFVHKYGRSDYETVNKWGRGFVHIKPIELKSIRYLANYLKSPDKGQTLTRMSNGTGRDYALAEVEDWCQNLEPSQPVLIPPVYSFPGKYPPMTIKLPRSREIAEYQRGLLWQRGHAVMPFENIAEYIDLRTPDGRPYGSAEIKDTSFHRERELSIIRQAASRPRDGR